jgi:putative nucleotidyltransferase with HDIG domain
VETFRLAELLGSLSLATDLAAGVAEETALRTAILSVRIGEALGIQGFERRDVYYAGLLRFIGCTALSHEVAPLGAGDDLRFMAAFTVADERRPGEILGATRRAVAGGRFFDQARGVGRILTSPGTGAAIARAHCAQAVQLARSLGMSEGVVRTLGEIYERWDGTGEPAGLRGDAIVLPARIVHVAWRMAAHLGLEGRARAVDVLTSRAGWELDPAIAKRAAQMAPALLEGVDELSVWDLFLAAEPRPVLEVARSRVRAIAETFGQFVDLKSPYTLGHSAGVAALATSAARSFGGVDAESVAIAAHLHDLGAAALPGGIVDRRGSLGARDRERVETHATQSERILRRSALLAAFAPLAAAHHERLDGSGYARGHRADRIDSGARILAAADVYQALRSDRPHRPAMSADAAKRVLVQEVEAGRLGSEAVDAVLAAAGETPAAATTPLPCELTPREAEVLALVARGLSNKQVAARLFVSPATVKRHLENIFEKTNVQGRAAAAAFAVAHGLV